jgi:sec-independent protein translocase protein TatA
MLHTLAIGMPGPFEWIIIAGIGLLIFGKRLPEVGKSLGKGIVEFKKGLKSVEDDVTMVDDTTPTEPRKQIPETPPHKFDPYTGKPLDETATTSTSTEHGTTEHETTEAHH